MKEQPILADATLAAMLRRRAGDGAPSDLAGAIRAAVAATPQARRPLWTLVAPPARTAAPALRLAWLVALVGLLLAVTLSAVVVGGELLRRANELAVEPPPSVAPAPTLPAVLPPIGQVYACPPGSTPDTPGPVDQAGPPEADSGMAFGMAFDRRAGRLVMAVTSVGGAAVETWTFDVCANTWTRMHPDREPSAFGWAALVYDVDFDVTILVANDYDPTVAGVSVWAYDLQADTWTEKGAAPTDVVLSLAYDPVSGLVVAASRGVDPVMLWRYDVESDTWTPIQQANAGPGDMVFAYDTSVDRMVAYTRNATQEPETWLFDIRTGTWSRSSAKTPGVAPGPNLPNMVYDEAAKRTVIVAWAVVAYDASANRWEMLLASRTGGWPTANMVYDPVNERLVGPGAFYTAPGVHVGRAGVFAFDPGTRESTVLLEPGAP